MSNRRGPRRRRAQVAVTARGLRRCGHLEIGPGGAIWRHTGILPLRFAAMVYDGVLLFGIAFAAGLLLLTTTGWTAPLLDWQRLVLQAMVFVSLGIYFCWCWVARDRRSH